MTAEPAPGAFPHQHGDPRRLVERIEAQLRERIEQAVEMAALELMVELRKREGRPAPETTSPGDRDELAAMAAELVAHLASAFRGALPEAERRALASAEATGGDPRTRELASQVFLARRLPDYWQRFEAYRTAYAERRPSGAAPTTSGWLRRLFGG